MNGWDIHISFLQLSPHIYSHLLSFKLILQFIWPDHNSMQLSSALLNLVLLNSIQFNSPVALIGLRNTLPHCCLYKGGLYSSQSTCSKYEVRRGEWESEWEREEVRKREREEKEKRKEGRKEDKKRGMNLRYLDRILRYNRMIIKNSVSRWYKLPILLNSNLNSLMLNNVSRRFRVKDPGHVKLN